MVLEIDGTNISVENTLDLKNPYFRFEFSSFNSIFKINLFRYPSGPVPVPPGQYHDSPTEQYWNSFPNENEATNGSAAHPNANPYSQNCNINNNLNASGDYDGTSMVTDWAWS